MNECRINFQNDVIDLILEALKTCGTGIGIAEKYDCEIEKGDYGSTLIFKPKEARDMDARDFFMLGYFVGRDYEEK